MKAEFHGTQIELEPNARPYLLKRIVADGFDLTAIFLLFLLLTALILRTPAAETYRAHFDRYRAIEAETAAAYGNDPEAVSRALSQNAEYRDEMFAANLHGYLLKAAACLLAEFPILLLAPLLTEDRATPGKRLTGLMPFYERRQSRATRGQIVFRFLFVYFIDSLALYLYTGTLTFLLVAVLRLTEMLLNRKQNKTLCDFLSGIRIIEKLSYDGIHSFQGGQKR